MVDPIEGVAVTLNEPELPAKQVLCFTSLYSGLPGGLRFFSKAAIAPPEENFSQKEWWAKPRWLPAEAMPVQQATMPRHKKIEFNRMR